MSFGFQERPWTLSLDSSSLCLLNLIKKDLYGDKQPVYLPVTLLHHHMVIAGGSDGY